MLKSKKRKWDIEKGTDGQALQHQVFAACCCGGWGAFGHGKAFFSEKKVQIQVLGHHAGSQWKHEAQNAQHLNLISHHLCPKCG